MAEQINKTYNPKEVEDRLYNRWVENGYFTPKADKSKEPFQVPKSLSFSAAHPARLIIRTSIRLRINEILFFMFNSPFVDCVASMAGPILYCDFSISMDISQ